MRRASSVALVIAIVSLTGCGRAGSTVREPAEHTTNAGGASSHAGSDTPVVAARPAPACPALYGADPPSCRDGDDPGPCTYPEGTCSCRVGTWCGGAAPPPRPLLWTCDAPRPACPTPGTACAPGSPPCRTGPCGFDAIVCENGVWTGRIGPRPP